MSISEQIGFRYWLNLASNMMEIAQPGDAVYRALVAMNEYDNQSIEEFLIMATQEAAEGDNFQEQIGSAEAYLNKAIGHQNSRVDWDPGTLKMDDPVWSMRRRILGAVAVNFAGH